MRKAFFAIAIFTFFFITCTKKKESFAAHGEIKNYDMALCPCCGGAVLQIDNVSGTYHVESLPGMNQQEFYNLSLPKRIQFNWQQDRNCGGIEYIKITSFQFE